MELPEFVRCLLKSYDPAALSWDVEEERYAIVCEILRHALPEAHAWLRERLSEPDLRDLVKKFHAAGFDEKERRELRTRFNLSETEIPVRPYIDWRTRDAQGSAGSTPA